LARFCAPWVPNADEKAGRANLHTERQLLVGGPSRPRVQAFVGGPSRPASRTGWKACATSWVGGGKPVPPAGLGGKPAPPAGLGGKRETMEKTPPRRAATRGFLVDVPPESGLPRACVEATSRARREPGRVYSSPRALTAANICSSLKPRRVMAFARQLAAHSPQPAHRPSLTFATVFIKLPCLSRISSRSMAP